MSDTLSFVAVPVRKPTLVVRASSGAWQEKKLVLQDLKKDHFAA